MSDELAQDDEGFEIADFGADDEDEDDVENSAANSRGNEGPRYDPPPASNTAKEIPRESLDGETIFAVGDENDRWSDEGSDDEERGKLVGKTSKDT